MHKKGEVTFFVILGITLLIVLILLFYVRVKVVPVTKLTTYEIDSVKDYVESCLKQKLEEASKNIYITHTAQTIVHRESLMEDYIESKGGFISGLKSCTNNFIAFAGSGLTIEDDSVEADVTAVTDGTGIYFISYKATVYYPVTIKKGTDVYSFDTIHAEYEIP